MISWIDSLDLEAFFIFYLGIHLDDMWFYVLITKKIQTDMTLISGWLVQPGIEQTGIILLE